MQLQDSEWFFGRAFIINIEALDHVLFLAREQIAIHFFFRGAFKLFLEGAV